MRGCITILVALILVAILVVGGLYVLTFAWPTSSSGLPTVAVSNQAAQNLDQKVAQIQQSVAEAKTSQQPVPISLRITEQELTSKAAQELARIADPTGLQPRNVQFHLVPGKVIITATIQFQGIDTNATITSIIRARQGQPTVTVESIQLGALPVPGGFQDQVAQELERSLAQAWADVPIDVQDVQIQSGVMIVTGIATPR